MQGNEQVISVLNEVLVNAHTSYMQFTKHSLIWKDRGYSKLAETEAGEAAKEKDYMEKLAYRILFLEGDPDLGRMRELFIGDDVETILNNDLRQQTFGLDALRNAVKTSNDIQDYGSRDLANEILKQKENKVDLLEAELGKLSDLGKQIYLSIKAD